MHFQMSYLHRVRVHVAQKELRPAAVARQLLLQGWPCQLRLRADVRDFWVRFHRSIQIRWVDCQHVVPLVSQEARPAARCYTWFRCNTV